MIQVLVSAAALTCVGQVDAWPATKVAVVNIPAVSERYQKTSDLEAQFEQRRAQLNQQRDALRDKIDRARRSLQEELKPNTPAYEQRRKELALLETELQWFVDTEGQKVEGGLAQSLRSIYDDIKAVVHEVAENMGIDVVLAADQLPQEAPSSTAQARQQIMLQKVLYWSPGVDITDEVVARLNQRYNKARRPATTSGAARPPLAEDPSARHPDASGRTADPGRP